MIIVIIFYFIYEYMQYSYRRTGWIGLSGVTQDIGLEPEETKCLRVSSGSRAMSRFPPQIPIHPVRR